MNYFYTFKKDFFRNFHSNLNRTQAEKIYNFIKYNFLDKENFYLKMERTLLETKFGEGKVNDIFKIVKDFKKTNIKKPVILMGYYNMIYQYGENNYLNKCKVSGVNGLIVVDLPWPENKVFAKKCIKKGIYFIQLTANNLYYSQKVELIK